MAITKIPTIVETVGYVLSQNQDKTYTEDQLINELAKHVESPRARLSTCVQSLVAAGFCGGTFGRGSSPSRIHFREGGVSGTPYTPRGEGYSDNGNGNGSMSDADRTRLETIIKDLQQKADDAFDDLLDKQSTINGLQKDIESKDQEIDRLMKSSGGIREVHTYNKPNTKPTIHKGTFHKAFNDILTLVEARENIYLYGPTGCGKSHVCHQIAEVLGMEFGFVSCSSGMSEGVLGGRLLPLGKSGSFVYSMSDYVRIYENGGVFLIDEIDAADPNVLLLINASLANGKMSVPNRPDNPYAIRHPDFVCVAAANTIGLGADRNYSGRNKLDDSTMDRFRIGQIYMDYDEEVERALCPDDDLRGFLWKLRYNIREARLERAVSTRFTEKAYKMKQLGWTKVRIAKSLMTGWKPSEVQKALSGCDDRTINDIREALAI